MIILIFCHQRFVKNKPSICFRIVSSARSDPTNLQTKLFSIFAKHFLEKQNGNFRKMKIGLGRAASNRARPSQAQLVLKIQMRPLNISQIEKLNLRSFPIRWWKIQIKINLGKCLGRVTNLLQKTRRLLAHSRISFSEES